VDSDLGTFYLTLSEFPGETENIHGHHEYFITCQQAEDRTQYFLKTEQKCYSVGTDVRSDACREFSQFLKCSRVVP
jgi:hypothetical protein